MHDTHYLIVDSFAMVMSEKNTTETSMIAVGSEKRI